MRGLRENAAAAAGEAPAWKVALLERKRAKLAAGAGLDGGGGAGAVVAESLGPLRENPFMRLEGERRRRRRRGAGAVGVACETPPETPPSLAHLLQLYGAMPGVRTIRADHILIIESSDPVEAAAPRSPPRDPPAAEIRAAQVVVYEPEAAPDPGLVSRLLRKFDRAAPAKGLPGPPPTGTRPGPPPAAGVFVQKVGSNSFVVNPRGHRPAALSKGAEEEEEEEGAAALPPPSSPGQRGVAALSKAVPSSRSPAPSSPPAAQAGQPKSEAAAVPKASPQPPAPSSATPAGRAPKGQPRPGPLFSSSCSFEIRPAPKPDLAAIPAHDLQAHALASLRLNSRNAFLFVPHRKEAPPEPPPPAQALPAAPEVPVTCLDEDLGAAMPPLKVLSPRLEGFHVPHDHGALALEKAGPALPPHRPLSTASVARTHTFTVVPKRKPFTTDRAWLQQEEEEEEDKARRGAPLQELGHLKKRYPTVNEIEVIGGYLSLNKSCISKSSVRRKKMKISFNETSMQTMFEYPSERSLEEGEEEEYATEVDEKPAFLIPHPSRATANSGLPGHPAKHSRGFNDEWQEHQPSSTQALPQETEDQPLTVSSAEKSHLSEFSREPALYF
ncbi:taperin isoform X2 [Erythrolamprus reginae]|uniref:taperin isoform X2 n=1 Tax=Erythrolamprus reginae TaxID=121349 RepID=UPI00396C3D8F